MTVEGITYVIPWVIKCPDISVCRNEESDCRNKAAIWQYKAVNSQF